MSANSSITTTIWGKFSKSGAVSSMESTGFHKGLTKGSPLFWASVTLLLNPARLRTPTAAINL